MCWGGGWGREKPPSPAKILYKKMHSFQSSRSKALWGWGRTLSVLIVDCDGAKGPRKEALIKLAVSKTFLVWRIKKKKKKRGPEGENCPFRSQC